MGDNCRWQYDEWHDYWEADCTIQHTFCLIVGTPSENGMIYCPFCSRVIIETTQESKETEND